MPSSIDHAAMREMNLSLILKTLRAHAPVSRVRLAMLTGLNKTSVSTMVKQLLDNGLVREVGVDSTSTDVGRHAINLELNSDAGYIISVEIGVGFFSLVAADFAFNIAARRYESFALDQPQETTLKLLLTLLEDIHREIEPFGRPLLGISVGVPGLVDVSDGTLLFAPNLEWQSVPLSLMIQARFPCPVYVGNEANFAAWGESYLGNQDAACLLYVSSGMGIGGGTVLNQQLMLGTTGLAGEIGHMTVDPAGIRCNCGNIGCWETVASQNALFHRVREAIGLGRKSLIQELTGNDLSRMTIPILVEAADQQDDVAREALEITGRWLGLGIANLLNILNPECVIFGGTLSQAHAYLLPVIQETIEQRALRWLHQNVEIMVPTYGADAAVMGGVALIHHEVLNNLSQFLP